MIQAVKLKTCQVRSKTESPCHHRAVVEIQGIPFCEGCAREQQAYFSIGKLTQEAQSLRNGPLAEARRFGEKGKVMAEDKSTSAEGRASSKEEYEHAQEWWEGYDPGMDVGF